MNIKDNNSESKYINTINYLITEVIYNELINNSTFSSFNSLVMYISDYINNNIQTEANSERSKIINKIIESLIIIFDENDLDMTNYIIEYFKNKSWVDNLELVKAVKQNVKNNVIKN